MLGTPAWRCQIGQLFRGEHRGEHGPSFRDFSGTDEHVAKRAAIALYKPKTAISSGLPFFQGVPL